MLCTPPCVVPPKDVAPTAAALFGIKMLYPLPDQTPLLAQLIELFIVGFIAEFIVLLATFPAP